jgi:hypothetical protein
MFGYAPQRQILPLMASFTSLSPAPHGSFTGHDLSGGTVSALKTVVLHESLLHWVQVARFAKAFDRGDLGVLLHSCKGKAAVHAPTIDMYSACATLAVVATFFGTGEVQRLAQGIEHCRAWINLNRIGLPIYSEGHGYRPRNLLSFGDRLLPRLSYRCRDG